MTDINNPRETIDGPTPETWVCVRCGLPGYDFSPSGWARDAQHRDTQACLLAAVGEIRRLQERVTRLEARPDALDGTFVPEGGERPCRMSLPKRATKEE